ncbi:hypothetical protein K4K58_001212 [Colletotrichum sp. SAR11_239]|nr:hypothetical protein K4K58_001212 [Colletotrichum sp. SAR11_239]
MIASIAVERRGVHPHAVAQVSIARFSNSGPLSLGYLVIKHSQLDAVVRLMIVLLILTTFAVQFVSTLLVSDLQQSEIISFARTVPTLFYYRGRESPAISTREYAENNVEMGADPDYYWFQGPRSAETFAEYSEPQIDVDGIDDTGPTIRAFLPLPSTDARQSLAEFRENAINETIYLSRNMAVNMTICALPRRLYMRIFADTITETGSPARAFHALYFTLERSIYYNRMSSYSLNEPDREAAVADIVTFEPMQVPKDFKGYWAVAGILAVFLAAFTAVIWLYRPTQYSLPGNSWHVIAQVSESAELAEVLQKARLATDDEVEKLIEGLSYPPSSPVSGGATSYVKKVLNEARRHFLAGRKPFVAPGSQRAMPRFVLQKGVFVGVPEEMNTTLRASGFRRRTFRKGSESESVD